MVDGSLPEAAPVNVNRHYRPGTLVLETEFETETGRATIIDFMPPADGADLVRIVVGRSGRVVFHTELVVRFNYGATVPWVNRLDDGTINAIAGPERLVLRTPAALYGEDLKTVGEFTVEAGQSVPFVLSYGSSFQSPPPAIDPFKALERYGSVLASMERSVSRRRALDRSRETLTHHTEGFDLRADGRDRRRRHDLASRALGRRAELGLSLLLAARRHLHALGLDESRILRRSTGMAGLAGARCRRQPAPDPNHVWSGRRAMAAGIDRPLAARLRELLACAYWQ